MAQLHENKENIGFRLITFNLLRLNQHRKEGRQPRPLRWGYLIDYRDLSNKHSRINILQAVPRCNRNKIKILPPKYQRRFIAEK
jgi:hypothetical protein